MRAGLAASTTTPGNTAPEGSRTVPAIEPCARTRVGHNRRDNATAASTTPLRMIGLLWICDMDDANPVLRGTVRTSARRILLHIAQTLPTDCACLWIAPSRLVRV